MADKITFDDKVSNQTSPLPSSKKLTAADVNEIKSIVNAHADDIDGKFAKIADTKIISTNSYTLLDEDAGKVLFFTSNNPIIITLPSGLTSNVNCQLVKKGNGNLLFSTGGGSILQAKGNTIASKYDRAIVIHEGNDVFGVYGNLTTSTIPSGTPSSWTKGHIWRVDAGPTNLDGYLFLPIGYSDNSDNYPAIIHLHGNGHIGSDPDILLGESLPYEINNGLELKSIVFCPQMNSSYSVWHEYLTDDALTYLTTNYRIDTNRVYITGYSLGAEGCYRYVLDNDTNVAAILPISGTSAALTGSPATFRDVAYFGVHGTADGTSHFNQTANAYEALNNLSPGPTVPPQVYFHFGLDHVKEVWNDGVYKKSSAPFDFEEWLLLHSRDKEQQADNYVTKAESSGHLHDYLTALNLTNKLSSSTAKTALLTRLSDLKSTADVGVRFVIDLGGDNTNDSPSPINNVTEEAATTSNILDMYGNITPFHFEIVNALSENLTNTGLNGEIFGLPATFWRNGCRISGTKSLKFKNLTPTNNYKLLLYAARDVNDYNAKESLSVTVNGNTQQIFCGHQTLEFAEFDDILPNASNEIVISLAVGISREPYINGIILIDKNRTPGIDITPPSFTIAPQATNFATTSFDITATLDEDGTVYAHAVAANSGAPSIATIKSSGQSENDTGNGVTISLSSLTSNTAYDVYVVAEDLNGNTQGSATLLEDVTTLDAGDTTPPTFDTSPAAGNYAPTSMDVTAELNENGTVYALAVIANSSAPSIATIKSTGISQADAGSGVTISLTGLTPSTTYDIYVVAEDLNNNTQVSATLLEDESTIADTTPPTFTTAPYVSGTTSSSIEVTAQLNEAGTLYAYAVTEGTTPAPSISTIKSSGVNDNEDSGSGVILEITGLSASTAYDIYVVAEDDYTNTQASSTKIADVSTLSSGSVISRFNLNATAQSVSGYVDVSGNPHSGVRMATDVVTGFGCRSAGTWNSFGSNTSNNAGGEDVDDGNGFAFNATAQRSIWYSYLEAVLPTIELFGLDNAKTYTVKLLCTLDTGLVNSNPDEQTWQIGSTQRTVNARSNTSQVMEWTGVSPSSMVITLETVNLVTASDQFFAPSVIEIMEE